MTVNYVEFEGMYYLNFSPFRDGFLVVNGETLKLDSRDLQYVQYKELPTVTYNQEEVSLHCSGSHEPPIEVPFYWTSLAHLGTSTPIELLHLHPCAITIDELAKVLQQDLLASGYKDLTISSSGLNIKVNSQSVNIPSVLRDNDYRSSDWCISFNSYPTYKDVNYVKGSTLVELDTRVKILCGLLYSEAIKFHTKICPTCHGHGKVASVAGIDRKDIYVSEAIKLVREIRAKGDNKEYISVWLTDSLSNAIRNIVASI